MKQVRFVPIDACNLKVREAQDGEQSREIVGMPIVYGVRSVNLTPWSEEREVYEVLEPGFISEELLQRSDVILNLNHSNLVPDVLGRYRNRPGRDTLTLDLLQQGMACRCSFPNTSNANDTLELMRRGDIDGMSFAFSDDPHNRESVTYERTEELHDGKEVWLRRVKRATGFFDVAIVTHPAYGQTSVATREFGEEIMRQIDEQIEAHKREADTDDDEAKKKAEEEEAAKRAAEEEAKKKADEEAKKKEEEEARQLAEQAQQERERMAMQRRNARNRAHRISSEILELLEY